MGSAASVIFGSNLKFWITAKGFFIVVLAAFVPVFLTGAWTFTHQADVATTQVDWEPTPIQLGRPVTFTATIENTGSVPVDAFNVTIEVGITGEPLPNGTKPFDVKATNQTRIQGLAAGETASIQLTWTPRPPSISRFGIATPADLGTFELIVDADHADELGEINEENNRWQEGIEVQLAESGGGRGFPEDFDGLEGNPNATAVPHANSGFLDIKSDKPFELHPNETVVFSANATNKGPADIVGAEIIFRINEFDIDSGRSSPVNETTQTIDLRANETRTVSTNWTVPAEIDQHILYKGQLYLVEVALVTPPDLHDPDVADNTYFAAWIVDRKLDFPTAPERATIRGFFIDIMENLQIPLVIPFIALFYAAGVLADDRERGNLGYILTRPVPRALLPLAKFSVGFVVASIALIIGTFGSFALLFGLGQGDESYLWAPMVLSLLTLLVYGAFFTLLGVLVERPYLIGAGIVLGWEFIAGNLVPWVANLTLSHHLLKVVDRWDPFEQLPIPAAAGPALDAMRNMFIAAVVFIGVAVWFMKRREFEVV